MTMTVHDPSLGSGTSPEGPTRAGTLRLAVIVGSTREGRVGLSIARWFTAQARSRTDLHTDLVDLAEFDFPAVIPREPTPAITAFTDRVDRADAVAMVTPEYNHGYPAALKQAIDFGCHEWWAKPIGFVSYGADGLGLRAVEQLRLVMASLHAVTVADGLAFNVLDGSLDADGHPRDVDAAHVAAARMLDQLVWWARALLAARTAHQVTT